MVSCLYVHAFDNIKASCPSLISNLASSLFSPQPVHNMKVATVEQQQWTDRLDISSNVDSAGEFGVAAAATADVLFCSGFGIGT
jgi:hypothetical protein